MSDADNAQTTEAQETPNETAPDWVRGLRRWLLRRVWYVHPGIQLRLNISPSNAFKILETSARPSIQRLHLRNVFTHGRRYFISPRANRGFRMLTTHKVFWHPRRRTSASAVLLGDFEEIDDATTRLTLHSRFRITYLLQVFLWPTFMTSMLVFMSWSVWLIGLCIAALYLFSWMGHRYNAALEAHEMVFFIEKALEDYISEPPETLPSQSSAADLVVQRDFAQAWDKFIEDMQDE